MPKYPWLSSFLRLAALRVNISKNKERNIFRYALGECVSQISGIYCFSFGLWSGTNHPIDRYTSKQRNIPYRLITSRGVEKILFVTISLYNFIYVYITNNILIPNIEFLLKQPSIQFYLYITYYNLPYKIFIYVRYFIIRLFLFSSLIK